MAEDFDMKRLMDEVASMRSELTELKIATLQIPVLRERFDSMRGENGITVRDGVFRGSSQAAGQSSADAVASLEELTIAVCLPNPDGPSMVTFKARRIGPA